MDKLDVLALARNLPVVSAEVSQYRYAKYYERSPFGPPLFFVARGCESQTAVGMAAVFPTRLRVLGGLVPAGISGDFAVDSDHRGFGPAIALQRAVLSALKEEDQVCVYGSPNAFAESVINRVGYADLGRLTRFVKVLEAKVFAGRYIRSPRLARLLSAIAVAVDPVLSALSRERLYRRSAAFSVEEPDVFDDRFTDLWQTAWHQHKITTERNVDFLNWKYDKTGAKEHRANYKIFALVAGDRIAGYVVYQVKDEVRHVFDILFFPSKVVADTLLSEFILDARRGRAAAITLLYLGPVNLLTRRLRAFGFLRRTEESGLRVHAESGRPAGVDLLRPENWYFLGGDTDV
ncbi:MAG TPA: GNAT family N-acetyltransferase [Gaiellaceae bacterium]|nr:GNAT family N-acetyltransferase [Gaiellaceae bacterium]